MAGDVPETMRSAGGEGVPARAVAFVEAGGIDVVTVIERAVREPAAGEIRIEAKAAAVNPADSVIRERGVEGIPPPWTPGMDLAGVVKSVGEGVERVRVGDAVMAAVSPLRPEGGAQAELVVVPADSAVQIPDGMSFAEAATLPMNGLTARLALETLDLPKGGTIAVTGGAGLLASYAIPMARELGLKVIADARPADAESVRRAGCELVVPRSGDFAAEIRRVAPDGVDGLIDTAALGKVATGAIHDGGRMINLRGWIEVEAERGIEVRAIGVVEKFSRVDWLEDLRDLASRGKLPIRPTVPYPPEQAGEAEAAMDAGGSRDRCVIVF